jgi:hypothetical protein
VTDHDGQLRAELQRVAAEHEPDRTAMLNRIAANRGAGAHGRPQTLRVAGVGLAVTTVLALGGVASWALAADNAPPPPPPPATGPVVISSTVPAPHSSPSPSSKPATSHPPHSAAATTPSSAAPTTAPTPEVRGHPGDIQVEKGSLWSDGSVTAAGRSTITLEASAGLTELDLTIRVAMTPGLASAGTDTVAGVTATVERRPDALLYHFVLDKGATLPAGTYALVARYGTASRDAGQDTYDAFGTDMDHKRLHVYGNFFAVKQ